jgi:hypothetical protein
LLRLPAVRDNAAMEAEPPKADPLKRKRPWLQFSLRSLLIFTVVCAIGAAWLGRKIERKRHEREAVEAITKLGGNVEYDYDYDDGGALGWHTIPTKNPPGPDWLRSLLGENFFSEVDRVSITGAVGKNMTDAGLIHLRSLPRLRYFMLAVNNLKVTDAGLESIRDLTQLQDLMLVLPNVTDAGLESLKGLTQLQKLVLWGPKITDAGVNSLQAALPTCKIYRL